MTVKEIADLLEINECTLSREFNKYDLPGPKRILMYLKVHHAVKLMENNGLKRQEVALLSGFSDERRMMECLGRVYPQNISKCIKSKRRGVSLKR
jgi:transcriptional regulator GlxA family with amidase domain